MKITILTILQKFILVILAFLLPIKPVLLTVAVFIAVDTASGVYRAKKRKEGVSSRRLSNIVYKMIAYQAAVILIYILEKNILQDFVALFTNMQFIATKLVAMTLITIELTSINENVKLATGVNLWDRFINALRRAKDVKDELIDITGMEEKDQQSSGTGTDQPPA